MVKKNLSVRVKNGTAEVPSQEISLRKSLEEYARREQLMKLLTGNFNSDDQISADLSRVGIVLDSEDQMVWLIYSNMLNDQLDPSNGINRFQALTRRMESEAKRIISTRFSCYVEHVERGTVCVIGTDHIDPLLPSDDHEHLDFNSELEQLGSAIIDYARDVLELDLFIYMGRPGPGASGAANSYVDAVNMMNYCQLVNEQSRLVQYLDFERISANEASGKQSLKLIRAYAGFIERQNYIDAKLSILALLDFEFFHNVSVPETMSIKLDMLAYLLIAAADSAFPNSSNDSVCAELINNIREAGAKKITMYELRASIVSFFDLMEDRLRLDSQSNWPAWLKPMLEYIQNNCCDPQLSVASISQRFGLTPAYITRVVKSYLNIGLLEFIQKQRLEKAMELIGTGKTLTAIAQETGFSNLRAMRRAFMKYEGQTPKQLSLDTIK